MGTKLDFEYGELVVKIYPIQTRFADDGQKISSVGFILEKNGHITLPSKDVI